jgi:hypothetical protein
MWYKMSSNLSGFLKYIYVLELEECTLSENDSKPNIKENQNYFRL